MLVGQQGVKYGLSLPKGKGGGGGGDDDDDDKKDRERRKPAAPAAGPPSNPTLAAAFGAGDDDDDDNNNDGDAQAKANLQREIARQAAKKAADAKVGRIGNERDGEEGDKERERAKTKKQIFQCLLFPLSTFDLGKKRRKKTQNEKKIQVAAMHAAALEQDASAFDYDEVYDEMKGKGKGGGGGGGDGSSKKARVGGSDDKGDARRCVFFLFLFCLVFCFFLSLVLFSCSLTFFSTLLSFQ